VISGGLVDVSRNLAQGLAGAALGLEGAVPAIELAGAIDPGLGLGDAAAWLREVAPILLEFLAAGADVDVTLFVSANGGYRFDSTAAIS